VRGCGVFYYRMNYPHVMSRTYLRDCPEEMRQRGIKIEIDRHYQQLLRIVPEAAIAGKTSYLYEPKAHLGSTVQPISTEDLVEAFKLKFPGCTITYFEDWVLQEQSPHHWQQTAEKTKVLKTGILIDWS
jgi:hypothetical protein